MSPPNGVPPDTTETGYSLVPTTDTAQSQAQVAEQNGVSALPGPTETEEIATEVAEDAMVVVPPDGGWGWVVVAASFACNMVVDGIIFSFGMFMPDIAAEFGVSSAEVTLVGSLMSGFYLMSGPFASALANRYGFRLVAILGSVLGVAAFVLSYFSTSVSYLYLSYGLLGGVGFGLIYVPAVITVGFYFEKYRALATGIGVCGSGIGTFLFAPICSALIASMGWRKALLVQGCIVATCVIFGSLFRPVKPTKVKDLKTDDGEKKELVMDSSKLPHKTRVKMENALKHIANSHHSLHHSQTTINKILGANNNADYPTVADVYHTITGQGTATTSPPAVMQKRLSVPFLKDADKAGKDGQPLLSHGKGSAPVIVPSRRPSYHRSRTNSEVGRRRAHGQTADVSRPMYRDDVFFGASLNRLPQYQSQTSLKYHLSVTRLPTKTDIEEEVEESRSCTLCPEAVRRTLATMLDISLLQSPSFILLALSGFFTMMGFYVPFMYIAARATTTYEWDAKTATFLLSAIGVTNTIGRIMCGMLSFFPKIDTLMVNNIAITIGGIATIMSGFSGSLEFQYFYAALFGLAISTFASLRSILVVELVGLEKLTNAFGLLLLFQGAAAAVGAPTAGAFKDATGSFDASFYLSGGLILFSAVLTYPLNMINRWEKRRADTNANKSVPI